MRTAVRFFSIALASVCASCASTRPVQQATGVARVNVSGPTTQPLDERALVSLESIAPTPALPAPATRPAARPPVDALLSYASARGAQLDGDRAQAIRDLRKAIEVDPHSFELWYSLGLIYAGGNTGNDKAIECLSKAVALNPDHLDAQMQLGRQYLTHQSPDMEKATWHLRLATLTREYRFDEAKAALVNLLLARALQQQGYDTAALGQYELLMRRIERNRLAVRGVPELIHFYSRRDVLQAQIGELHQKLAETYQEMIDRDRAAGPDASASARQAEAHRNAALRFFKLAAERSPDNLEYQRRVCSVLLMCGRDAEARDTALGVVRRMKGNHESVELLSDVLRKLTGDAELIPQLQKLAAENPNNRPLLMALFDALRAAKRDADAERILRDVPLASLDGHVLGKLADLYRERSQVDQAAKLLIETSAKRPELVSELEPVWVQLTLAGPTPRLRAAMVGKIDVTPQARPAKAYWQSRLADQARRETPARSLLEQAVASPPMFAPAYRSLVDEQLSRRDLGEDQRIIAACKTVDRAKELADPALACELWGLVLLSEKKFDQAQEAFEQAIKLGRKTPELRLSVALVQLRAKQIQPAERGLWALVSDYPNFDEGYQALFRHYLAEQSAALAVKVLNTWLEADPDNVPARVMKASLYMQINQMADAERIVHGLLGDYPQDPQTIAILVRYYTQCNRRAELIKLLQQQQELRPYNRAVAEALVGEYAQAKRPDLGEAALDRLRRAVAGDSELLYYTAHLYERVDKRNITEQVLAEVLKLDPDHPGAANDLGYMWAEDGRKLDEAETLIRSAIVAEPENAAYLDSLGWVLYKRGKFADAQRMLQHAMSRMIRPDPVVLDHLGDALYRLDKSAEAAKQWQRSLDEMGEEDARPDMAKLRQQLLEKIKQHDAGAPVKVAPTGDGVAKNL